MALGDVVAATGTEGFRLGLVATSFSFGFRHGIDWDHIAALTDITSSQESTRRSMLLATMYAIGHAVVVLALGVAAIVLAEQLPPGVDHVMERFVGATLIVLGVYVLVALARHGSNFRMRSRWMLLFAGARRGRRWLNSRRSNELIVIEHEHDHAPDPQPGSSGAATATRRGTHRHVARVPDDPFIEYGEATAFGVGMIHGIGAETPTQVLIFLAAAQAGGKSAGVVLLLCFLGGLVASNSLIALAATFGFRSATNNFKVYATVSIVAATFSLVIGALFLFGRGGLLPTIFTG
jgi:high-affinity nickel-transport protein